MSSSGNKKSQKTSHECDNEDLISNLPDSLITDILSCLPTKYAVQTSLLSKDWRYKWTSLCCIKISNGVILCSTLSKCTSLKELELSNCTLRAPKKFRFPSLTTLRLNNVQIMNANPRKIKLEFSFPMLKSLELIECCIQVKFLKIFVPSMGTFIYELHSDADIDPCKIKIVGESLTRFETYGLFPEYLRLPGSTVSTVECAVLHINDNDNDMNRDAGKQALYLLKQFSDLRELTIYYSVAEAIATGLVYSYHLPRYNKLERLQLFGSISEEFDYSISVEALIMLLNAAPFLEYLIIGIDIDDLYEDEDDDENEDSYDYDAVPVESIPSCLVSHLKKIEFMCFNNCPHEFNLARFLLKNGSQLKEFCVGSSSSDTNIDELRNKLSAFPRASKFVEFTITRTM